MKRVELGIERNGFGEVLAGVEADAECLLDILHFVRSIGYSECTS